MIEILRTKLVSVSTVAVPEEIDGNNDRINEIFNHFKKHYYPNVQRKYTFFFNINEQYTRAFIVNSPTICIEGSSATDSVVLGRIV